MAQPTVTPFRPGWFVLYETALRLMGPERVIAIEEASLAITRRLFVLGSEQIEERNALLRCLRDLCVLRISSARVRLLPRSLASPS